eukprot:scaffold5020_cov179-Amphora_coffeaeformis.AAC.3
MKRLKSNVNKLRTRSHDPLTSTTTRTMDWTRYGTSIYRLLVQIVDTLYFLLGYVLATTATGLGRPTLPRTSLSQTELKIHGKRARRASKSEI